MVVITLTFYLISWKFKLFVKFEGHALVSVPPIITYFTYFVFVTRGNSVTSWGRLKFREIAVKGVNSTQISDVKYASDVDAVAKKAPSYCASWKKITAMSLSSQRRCFREAHLWSSFSHSQSIKAMLYLEMLIIQTVLVWKLNAAGVRCTLKSSTNTLLFCCQKNSINLK